MKNTSDATELIPYSLSYTTSGSGSGKGTPISVNISGSVAEIAYINALEGTYEDTVTLTVAP
jgi:hypothetical protein